MPKVDGKDAKEKAEQPPPIAEMYARVKMLAPYLWPKDSLLLQTVAAVCFLLLATGRIVNLFVPILLGSTVEALSMGDNTVWLLLAGYVGLRFLQGSGGIIAASQAVLWIPVAQYSDVCFPHSRAKLRLILSAAANDFGVLCAFMLAVLLMLCDKMTFDHLLNLSMSYHTKRKTGEVLRVLDRGSAINSFFQM